MPRPLDEVLAENEGFSGGSEPVRQQFGWGDRFGAAVDSAQASLYGVAEAAGSDWAGEQRRRNQGLSETTRMRAAQDTGTPDSFRDIRGVRDAARWVGGLAVDTAPHLAAIAAGGVVGGPVGAAAAAYPLNLGDVLQSQREQAGRTDLGSAAALAVPYTAADMVGIEGALARRELARNTIRALDRMPGLRGGLARTGATAARVGAVEAGAETFQEGMSQFGRMAVDPNEDFYNERSAERFLESAVGGGALGGAFGGVGGGWRRSKQYTHQPVDQGSPVDLTQRREETRPGLQLRSYAPDEGPAYRRPVDEQGRPRMEPLPGQYDLFNPDGSPTYAADRSFSDTNPLRPLEPSWSTSPGASTRYDPGIPFEREFDTGGLDFARPEDPRARGIPFEPVQVEGGLSLAPRGPLPQREGIPFERQFDTGRLALRAPIDAGTVDLFTGQPTLPPQQAQPFELEPPGSMADAGQFELDLQPPAQAPVEPQLLPANRRGAQGQLPFSANTRSPQGQLFQGRVESLAAEGYLDDSALTQASTLIAQGKFGKVNSILKEAEKNKAAALELAERMRAERMQSEGERQRKERADELFAQAQDLKAKRQALVDASPARVRKGTKRAKQIEEIDLQLQEVIGEWGQLTSKKGSASADQPRATEQRAGNAGAGGRVQRAGGDGDAAVLQPVQPAAPAGVDARSAEDAPAVPADGQRTPALEGVTSEALVETADDAKDLPTYENALDELYRRWRDDGDEVAERYFEENSKVRGFAADLARVRERAGENAPQAPKKPASEGKRGLKLGRVETGKLDEKAKATDDLLRGLAQPKFSLKNARPANPQRTARIQAFLDDVVSGWENQPRVVVLDSITAQTVPQFLSDAYRAMLSRDGEAQVPVGVFSAVEGEPTIYVFANGVDSSAEALATVFHEGLGHYGLRGLYGKAMVPVLDLLARQRPDLVRAKAREYGLNVQDPAQRLEAAEEVLAEMAESRPNLTWVQRAVAAIRSWLRENVPGFSQLRMSDAEVVRDYIAPARDWVQRGKGMEAGSRAGQVVAKATEDFAAAERLPSDREYDPARFKLASPTTSEAFRRWFGRSKVVNDDGTPKVMYHGTARDITTFRPKQANAIFVTPSPVFAESFAGASDFYMQSEGLNALTQEQRDDVARTVTEQIEAELPPESELEADEQLADAWNDYFVKLEDWRAGTRPLHDGFLEDKIRRAAEKYLSAAQNIMPVYVRAENPFDYTDRDQAKRVYAHMRRNGTDLGMPAGFLNEVYEGRWSTIEAPQFQQALRELGHDSFYVVEGGVRNLAVYDPNQVKSATGNNGEYSRDTGDIRFKLKSTPADEAVAKSFAKVPYANTALGKAVQDALFDASRSATALKFVTNDQIAEGYKHLPAVQAIHRATSRMASVANRYLETAAQTAKRWRALGDEQAQAMQEVMLRSTMEQMHVSLKDGGKYLTLDEAWKHSKNDHLDRTKPDVRNAFGKLYRDFHALPAQAKNVYDQVRDNLTAMHEDQLRAMRRNIASQYVSRLANKFSDEELLSIATGDTEARTAAQALVKGAGTAAEQRAMERMVRELRDLNSDFGTLRGPYFPLVRFGDHVVVLRSQGLVDLEASATKLKKDIDQALQDAPGADEPTAEAHQAKIDELREQHKTLREQIEKAKADEKSYVVEFYERASEAERRRIELTQQNPAADVYASLREDYYRALDGASPAFLRDMTQTLESALAAGGNVTPEAQATAVNALRDMYLRRQPERSALRRELKRMTVEGVKAAEMLRGYTQASSTGAWRVSRLEHAAEITDGLAKLSEDNRNPDAKKVLNELKARFVGDLAMPEQSDILRFAGNATYFMHLGFNLSYFLTNATQSWMTSLPVMAGRHGMANAANSLTAASKDTIALLKAATAESVKRDGKVVGLQLRLEDKHLQSLARDEGELQMLRTLTNDGVIDITIKHDLGAMSSGDGGWWSKTVELSSALANYPELYNRLATSLAAYRMERARQVEGAETAEQQQQRATEYAEKIINRTHFNYSPENAPRIMRGQFARLIFQFKRYQQGMLYLYAKLIRDAYQGDADARRALAYLLGMTVATTGVSGLPIAAPIALATSIAASAFPDDDEPEWLQQWYEGMKDAVGETPAQALVKGAGTVVGLDLSTKLGHGNVLNPVSFANTAGKDKLSSEWWQAVVFSALGPAAMLVGKQLDAAGRLADGDLAEAAQLAMPTFAANAVRAVRQGSEGLTTKAGDTLMTPEEFNAFDLSAKAVGFQTVNVSDTYDRRAAFTNMIANRRDARQALLRKYYDAVKSGDTEDMEAVQAEIAAFNDRQPADQVRAKDLAASIKQRNARAAETRGGLRVGKRDADSYTRLMGEE